jgi:hypothetical protein
MPFGIFKPFVRVPLEVLERFDKPDMIFFLFDELLQDPAGAIIAGADDYFLNRFFVK